MLKTQNLSKRFNGTLALDAFSLDVAAGEVYCLLGANGAGKTTTIHLLLGFLKPDTGEVRVGGIEPATDPAGARQLLAYIPEQVTLYPQLSGIENLRYFTGLAGRKLAPQPARQTLLRAGLPADAVDRRLSGYSKGMRQKVGIAIALAKHAKGLLLDEPLSGLDPLAANEFCVQLKQFALDGAAVLVATHDLFRAKQIATRIGILKNGRKLVELDAARLDATQLETLYLQHIGA